MAQTSSGDPCGPQTNHGHESSIPSDLTYMAAVSQQLSARQKKAINQQYLTPQEEKSLVTFIWRAAADDRHLTPKAVRALALAIRLRRTSSPQVSTNDDVLKPPGKNWVQYLYKRHPELKSRKVKAIDSKRANGNIYEKVKDWFEKIGKVLSNPDVLPENIYNLDETGILLGHSATLTVLVHASDRRGTRGTLRKRELVTSIECVPVKGKPLNPLIIWPASTHRSAWTTHPTPGWHYACSKTGYTNKAISLYWIQKVFDPQTREKANGKPRILINDGLTAHETPELLRFCLQNNIIVCRLPSHTSHKLQPLDVGIFGPLKSAYREQVEKLCRGGAGTVGKQHLTLLYSRARCAAFSESNINAAWEKVGLVPFNPDRVLSTMVAPAVSHTLTEATLPHLIQSSLHSLPYTPVTSDGFKALRNLVEGETQDLSELNKHRIEKALNAGERALAKESLLLDENRQLVEQNYEKRIRTSNPSKVVGPAKIMSYEEIVAELLKLDVAAPNAGDQCISISKQQVRASSGISNKRTRLAEVERGVRASSEVPNKRTRLTEAERAVREIESSGMQEYCCVFESWCD